MKPIASRNGDTTFVPSTAICAMSVPLFATVPIIALTATATPQVREDIVRALALRDPRVFVSSFNRPNLHYRVRPKFNTLSAPQDAVKRARASVHDHLLFFAEGHRGTCR